VDPKPCGGIVEPLSGFSCGKGTSGECPSGSVCDIHPSDNWAVCCPLKVP